MFVLPFLGIAIIVLGSLPMVWVAILRPKKRSSEASSRRMQFGLRSFLLWTVPIVAITVWILSWDGPFFTKRSVISQKAAALTLLVLALYLVFFLRWVRQMKQKVQQAAQSESEE